MSELTRLSIQALQRGYASRQFCVREVVEAYLTRIKALDGDLQTYVTVTAEDALRGSEELDRQGYAASQSLYGVPVAPKDLFATAGVRTTAGSRLLSEWVPEYDAAAVERLRTAGAVSLGKLNTHEFAFGGTSQTWERQTRNPWDRKRVPGGSSGGSGAALTADLCAVTIGTDTGGSGRIPAHCCGAVGLKPTYGRISRFGVVPLSWNLDHVAPMARSVRDVAALLEAIAGPDPRDTTTLGQPPLPSLVDAPASIPGVRVGVDRSLVDELCSDEVRAGFQFALAVLGDLGAHQVDVRVFDLALAEGAQWAIIAAEAAAYHRDNLRTKLASYGEDVAAELVAGERLTAMDYIRGQQLRRQVSDHFRSLFETVDIVALPVMAAVAPTFDEAAGWTMPINGQEVALFTVFTGLCLYANLTGLPALALPCRAWGSDMPVAFQLMASPWREELLLRVGSAYQEHLAWERERPVLVAGA